MNDGVLQLVANMVDDPELRFTPAGVAWARFSVASTPRVFDRTTGEYRDGEPLFIGCTVWRELAEHAAETLRKGMQVIVVGRLRLSKWTDDEGVNRSIHSLVLDAVGPNLRFATAVVTRTVTGRGRFADEPAPDDEWESATRERPAPASEPVAAAA